MRIVIIGNAGAGKSWMAKRLKGDRAIALLSLDEITWNEGLDRKPLSSSLAELHEFVTTHEQWIVEGCYGELAATVLPYCDELRFLNPGVEVCLCHCRQRPWEPSKFASPEEQRQTLDVLLAWVSDYPIREDDCGLAYHRRLFDRFSGNKREYVHVSDY